MPLNIVDHGKNNKIEISDKLREAGSGTITFEGDDNFVQVADTTYNFGVYITLNHNSRLTIGQDVNCFNLVIYINRDAALTIGTTVGFNGIVRLSMHEPGNMKIGDGCLFADQVEISISDMHSIVDATTGQRLNPARDINIGHRVWVGNRSMVMKNVSIGDGSVIGAMSLVSRSVPPNCVAAGNPAKVVRENVSWDFRLL